MYPPSSWNYCITVSYFTNVSPKKKKMQLFKKLFDFETPVMEHDRSVSVVVLYLVCLAAGDTFAMEYIVFNPFYV